MSLQEALKLLRLEMGITQADLAKKLNKAVISVNRWENGKGFPSRANAADILAVARKANVSDDCITYLNDVLMPEAVRRRSAADYGFPDIDRDFLFQMADGSTNAMYAIEAGTYNLLYVNRKAESMAEKFASGPSSPAGVRRLIDQSDKRCFHYFANRSTPCEFCPLSEFGRGEYKDTVITTPVTKTILRTHAKLTRMKGRDVYAIYLTDITYHDAERHTLYELTNDIPDGVGIYHIYYNERIELAFMNEAFYKMIGPERKEALLKNGDSDLSLIHPDDRKLLMNEIRASIAGKHNVALSMRMQIFDGQYYETNLTARLLKKDTEKLTFYCLFKTKQPLTI